MNDKKKLSAKEVLKDVKDRLSDDQLMSKYQLSATEVNLVLRKLVDRGWITQSELNERSSLSGDTIDFTHTEGLGEKGDESVSPGEKSLAIRKEFATRFNFSKEDSDPKPVVAMPPQAGWILAVLGVVFAIVYLLARRDPPPTGLVLIALALVFSIMGSYRLTKIKGCDPGWGLLAGVTTPIGPIVLMVITYTGEIEKSRLIRPVSSISYEMVRGNFCDPNSSLTTAQKSQLWDSSYENECVRWCGEVMDYDDEWMSPTMKVKMADGGTVLLDLTKDSRDTAMNLKKGTSVSFVGQFGRETPWTSGTIELVEVIIES